MFESFADWLVFSILGIDGRLGSSLRFFVYDTFKISFLIIFMIILMGFVNFFFPVEKVQKFLSRHSRFGVANFMAASFGAITPFCSCSSVPLFIGFLKGGIPIGVTISFLVTSPLVNEIALVLFWSYFGPKLTVLYALTGILVGTFVGMALSRVKYEGNINQWVIDHLNQKSSLKVLSGEAKADFINILKDSFFYI